MSVICALIPRFQLSSALEASRQKLSGASALAPEPGAAQLIGEASASAEAVGVRAGMRIGEALSRCPELILVTPDPEYAERNWDQALSRLEGIGAQVESERPGELFFEARGLRGLWGGTTGVMERAMRELGPRAQIGAAPGRFCAYAAARRGAAGRIVADDRVAVFLGPLPVSLLHGHLGPNEGADDLPNQLEKLGIDTLGRLACLPAEAVADRFGTIGLLARMFASGEDVPLRPRTLSDVLAAELELPEAASGPQLERALEMLIGRLLADRARKGRPLRSLRLSARLAAGGGWRREAALRSASADPEKLLLALGHHLSLLPAPAAVLRLEALDLGEPGGEQTAMGGPEEARRLRISEAVRQVRAAGGADAVLRVLEIDPDSRLPERRVVLMPYPEGG